jgi:hypothetical protein
MPGEPRIRPAGADLAVPARLRRLRPVWLLAAALTIGAALVLFETRGHSLLFDEWSFFADYRGHGASVLLNPFGGNLELLPLLIYKAVFAVVGPSAVALRLILVALDVTCAVLLFVLLRTRVGDWIALAGAVLVMVLGAAADVVAASLGIAILLSCACGLGALVALETGTRRGDRLACLLLAAAVASNSAGLPFLAGAAVEVLFVRPGERRQRLWVFALPLALYLLWRLWALHLEPLGPLAAHPTEITLANIGSLPSSIATSAAAAATTVTGLFRSPGAQDAGFSTKLGPPLAVALVVLAWLRVRFGPPVGRRIAVFLAMPIVYWALIALVVSDRVPTTSRYQYAGAIFLLLACAELARGIRISPPATAAVVAGLALAAMPNLVNLHDTASFLRYNGELNRAQLAAIEIARDTVPYDLLVEPIGGRLLPGSATAFTGGREPTTDAVIASGRYLRAADDFGSAAYGSGELSAAPPDARAAADRELVAALGLTVAPAPAALCKAPAEEELVLPAGGVELRAGPLAPLTVALRRFGDGYAIDLGAVPPGETRLLAIPQDRSPVPWRAQLGGAAGAVVCPVSAR